MKAYFKKIAALTAAALLVLSMAACGGNDDTESTAPVDDTNSVVEDIPADDTNASNEDVSGESDTAASNDTSDTAKSEEGGDKTPTSSSSNSDTLSKDEAVALFNKATATKSKSGNRYTKVDLVEVPGGAILSGALSPLLPNPDKATAIKSLPNGTMNASDFSSVTAKKSGNNWVLSMTVKAETAPNNAANARAFEELPQSEIDKALGSLDVDPMSGVKFTYSGGSIEATVTADGKLVSATYTMKVQLTASNVTAVGGFVKITSAKVNITQTDKF